jgi:beta-glucosidase
VGIVLIHCPAFPATESEADQDAARWFDGFFNRWYFDPIFRGCYPADAIADRIALGHLTSAELPFVQDADLAAIATPLDFLGVNYYSRAVMRAGPKGRPVAVIDVPDEELTDMGWEVYPEGLHTSLLRIYREYWSGPTYITENGAAYTYPAHPDGSINDPKRIDYLREHLLAAHRAMADGVPLRGYFLWSLLDNFEWGLGYEKRFGVFAVDAASQRRTPKESAYWYRDVVAARAVADTSPAANQGEHRALDP